MKLEKLSEITYQLPVKMIEKVNTPSIRRLVTIFESEGFEMRIVGGAVRDLLLGHDPKDFDLATNAKPDETENICKKYEIGCYKTGLQHGTITAVVEKVNYEITSLRCDIETNGRHAVVQYINDWYVDAERRDLTINAMSLTLNGVLYDYFNGVKDINERKINFVNDPAKRIREDYLRILRFFRFYTKLGDQPASEDSFDKNVLETIKNLAENLKNISSERIWSEFSGILVGSFAPSIIKIMKSYDVLKYIGLSDTSDSNLIRLTVYHACSIRKSLDIPSISATSLLSAFFDDLQTAEKVCRQLKLSNIERDICLFIIGNRKETINPPDNLSKYKQLVVVNFDVIHSLKVVNKVIQLMLVEGASDENIRNIRDWEIPLFPVKGTDLKSVLKGPSLGKAITDMKQKWIKNGYSDSKEDLIAPYIKNSLIK